MSLLTNEREEEEQRAERAFFFFKGISFTIEHIGTTPVIVQPQIFIVIEPLTCVSIPVKSAPNVSLGKGTPASNQPICKREILFFSLVVICSIDIYVHIPVFVRIVVRCVTRIFLVVIISPRIYAPTREKSRIRARNAPIQPVDAT